MEEGASEEGEGRGEMKQRPLVDTSRLLLWRCGERGEGRDGERERDETRLECTSDRCKCPLAHLLRITRVAVLSIRSLCSLLPNVGAKVVNGPSLLEWGNFPKVAATVGGCFFGEGRCGL